jgi:thioredoxin-related protein
MKNKSYTVTYRLPILIVLLFTLSTQSIAQSETGIQFINAKNWQEVLSMAKSLNKNILVDAFATWCGPCQEMDEAVYTLNEVGGAVNKQFVAIKLQMDQTSKDNERVRGWYTDVNELQKKYHIEGFPCYLFFTADGELIYKDLGYKTALAFIKLVQFAADPTRKAFRQQLAAWKNGRKDYLAMPDLVKMVREVLGDQVLALEIAKDYKRNYLDKLSQDQLLSNENLLFIIENGGEKLLNSNDPYFKALYEHPEILDSSASRIGYGENLIKNVIAQEEIALKLFRDGKALPQKPDWKKLEQNIKTRYPKIDAQKLVLNEKINYYRRIEDWNLYTFYKSEQIKQAPPKVVGMDIFFALNSPAWDAFLNCSDPKALKRALEWSELSLKLEKRENQVQFLDTKANLQYKLGKVEEAITTEQEAIALEDSISVAKGLQKGRGFVPDFKQTVEKMRTGQITWPDKNSAFIKKD